MKLVGTMMRGDGRLDQTYSSFCLIDRVGIGIFGRNGAARQELADKRSLIGSQYTWGEDLGRLSSVGWKRKQSTRGICFRSDLHWPLAPTCWRAPADGQVPRPATARRSPSSGCSDGKRRRGGVGNGYLGLGAGRLDDGWSWCGYSRRRREDPLLLA